ncbi:MAG: hypothetical protein R3B06_30765 [Kofleriaceae bacterium]
MATDCRHPLCQLIGGACSLTAGVSRGCRAGPGASRSFAPAVVDELRQLLTALAPIDPGGAATPAPGQAALAARLARLIRAEARADRNVLVLARDGDLDDDLGARLEALCRRRPVDG